MSRNVLVIGNGFDLAHGLKTSYNDFLGCVRDELAGRTGISAPWVNEFKSIIKTNGFIKFFLEYENEIPGWVDCESLMRYMIGEIEEFFINYERYSPNGKEFFKSKIPFKQIDVLEKFDLFDNIMHYANDTEYIFKDTYFNTKYGLIGQEVLKFLKVQLDDLIRALQIYLQYYMPVLRDSMLKMGIPTKAQIASINPSYVISFNYTDTYKVYGIDSKDVYHVHGSLEKGNMVLGYNDEDPDNLDFVYFKKYFQRIQKLTGDLDEEKIIQRGTDGFPEYPMMHFYGHSMDKTDGDIIGKLVSMSIGFVIYTYNQEDYEKKVINIIDIFGKERATEKIQSGWIKFVPCDK